MFNGLFYWCCTKYEQNKLTFSALNKVTMNALTKYPNSVILSVAKNDKVCIYLNETALIQKALALMHGKIYLGQ